MNREPLTPCTLHPVYRDALGLVTPCPPECDYWTRRREWCAEAARSAEPRRSHERVTPKREVPTSGISRLAVAPLTAHKDARRALGLYAEGKISAEGLRSLLEPLGPVTNTPLATIKEIVLRALCVKMGLPLRIAQEAPEQAASPEPSPSA